MNVFVLFEGFFTLHSIAGVRKRQLKNEK